MRKLSPAYVVTSVVLALVGGSTFAATAPAAAVARPNNAGTVQSGVAPTTTSSTTNRALVVSTVPTSTNGSTASSQSSDTNSAFASGNPAARSSSTTNTTGMTLSDGSRSGSNTDSSAANAPVGASASTAPGANGSLNSSSAANLDGSRSGSNIDSSASLTPLGTTSAIGTLGSSSVNSTGTTPLGTPGINAAASVNGIVSPYIGGYGAVNANGETVPATANNGYAGAAMDQGQFNNTTIAAANVETARNSQNFDRAVNVVKRDRMRVGRNGQLLQSIAPRTNADRSREMPDDPLPPTLTGANSTLTR